MVRREGQAYQPPAPFHMVFLYLLSDPLIEGWDRHPIYGVPKNSIIWSRSPSVAVLIYEVGHDEKRRERGEIEK